MTTKPWIDLAERVGWTFVQSLAGAITAGGTAVELHTFDWRAALAGGGTAALLCLLKVAGVRISALAGAQAPPAAPVAPTVVAPADVAVGNVPAAPSGPATVEFPAVPASGQTAAQIAVLSAAAAAE
jgi:hypothetical protein